MSIDIQIFADLFKIKVRILRMKYLDFWEETKWLRLCTNLKFDQEN